MLGNIDMIKPCQYLTRFYHVIFTVEEKCVYLLMINLCYSVGSVIN
ncbi:hypothetical protein JOE23_000325 [Amphibacillus cookii]|nr:hypothetical protein [Amphibacillus cookii]